MSYVRTVLISALATFVVLWIGYLLLVAEPQGRCVSGTLCPHGSKGLDGR
jgi:hypothetical protein